MHGFRAIHAALALLCLLLLAGCATPEPATPLRRPTPLPPPRTLAPAPTPRPPPRVRPAPAPSYRVQPPAAPAPTRRAIPATAWKLEADRWLGTPHRLGGMDRRGIDCSGLTWQICRAVAGVTLPHNSTRQFAYGTAVPASILRAGDLVFFSEPGKGIFHVGLCLDGDRFIHASTSKGVIISSLRQPYYATRFCGAKRLVQ